MLRLATNSVNKRLQGTSFTLLVIVSVVACAASGRETPIEESSDHEIRIYEVFGMGCPGCHGGLEKLVNKIRGILHTKADWEKNRLTVTLRQGSELDDKDVFDAIRRANFTPGKRIK